MSRLLYILFTSIEAKHPKAKPVISFFRKMSYKRRSLWIILRSLPRYFGIPDKKYNRLRKFRNLHKDDRCFIIATGPSLTYEDLEKLKNEVTFSMNSIILSYEKTDFRPTYYGIQDANVYKQLYSAIVKYEHQHISFYSAGLENCGDKYRPPKTWIPLNLNAQYHFYEYIYEPGNFFTRFSANAYAMLYDGYSITYTLLELAIYMGFKEIYLLGCDSTYLADKNKQHFIESGQYDPEHLRITATDRLTVAYKKAKEYADKHGIKIYNATRGGALEVFPRVNFDDLEIG